MKYTEEVDVTQYKKGMENGYDCFGYESWNISKCTFSCGNGKDYRDTCLKENRSRPYINTIYGKKYVSKGDYIVNRSDGSRTVYKPDEFNKIFKKLYK